MLKKIYITHGYTANSQKHWFPWLKERLEKQGFLVQVFDIPNSEHPTPEAWLAFHQQQISEPDLQSYFIAHSLGCIATLRYLQSLKSPIGGLILVSGFAEHLPNLPELDPFTEPKLDILNLIQQIPNRLVIASDDDHIVNVQATRNLAKKLQAEYIELSGYGHFLDRQGVTELPILYEQLLKMVKE